RALPRVDQVSTFHCVTGWSVKNVHWGGVRMHDVLAAAGPQSSALALEFVSMEVPYIDYLTRQEASLHDVMLAYEMDGKPLPRERLLHWVNAAGFFFLLVTGLILYLPSLSVLVSRRQTVQAIHFWGGVGWLAALAAVVVLGFRRLLATAREIEQFDRDDVLW